MSQVGFKPATRKQLKVKIGLMGTAGTGKTWNALAIAEAMAGGKGIGVIDSERGRAEAYAGDFKFDHLVLRSYAPESYIEALELANDAGYDVIVVDSISHEWMGKDGILSSVDRFGGWKEATPRHDEFVEALFRLPRHVICTMRAKTQYSVQEIPRPGGGTKQEITKLGVGPVQRDNVEYEFDLLGMLELDHSMRVHKSVMTTILTGEVLQEADDNPRALGRRIAFAVTEWVDAGQPVAAPVEADEREIEWLRVLLNEEGFDDERIDSRFKKRRLELGALTPEYVQEQAALAETRLASKNIDVRPIRDAFEGRRGYDGDAQTTQAEGMSNESNEAVGGAEGESEPQSLPGVETGTNDADPALVESEEAKAGGA